MLFYSESPKLTVRLKHCYKTIVKCDNTSDTRGPVEQQNFRGVIFYNPLALLLLNEN
jgi:hypothetical protein